MNRVFLDTSAAYALLVSSDANHARAASTFKRLRGRGAGLTTTSYVLVETYALLEKRVGILAVRAFRDDIQPLVQVRWITQDLHERALDLLVARGTSDLSLVDAVSIVAIRDQELDEVFAYGPQFVQEGFPLLD